MITLLIRYSAALVCILVPPVFLHAEESSPRAFIDGTGLGWQTLNEDYFTNVNCALDTWT
jgi:hypothetical protein